MTPTPRANSPNGAASAASADTAPPYLIPAPVSPGPARLEGGRLTAHALTSPFDSPPAAPPPTATATPPASPPVAKPSLPQSTPAVVAAAPTTPPQVSAPVPPAGAPASPPLPPILLAPAATLSPVLTPSLPVGAPVVGGEQAEQQQAEAAATALPPVVPRLPPHTVPLRVLVAGPPGCGKSKLIAALAAGGHPAPGLATAPRACAQTRALFPAAGGTLAATFVEAALVTTADAARVAACAAAGRAAYLDAERAPRRRARGAGGDDDATSDDPRFDAALVLIPPHAPVTKATAALVSALAGDAGVPVILPVLSGADAYSQEELAAARAAARSALAAAGLPPLPFADGVLDAAGAPRAAPPFASVCGRGVPSAAGAGPASDVAALRALLLGPGVADVKRAAAAAYEAWRTDALRGGWDRRHGRGGRFRAAIARAPWRTVAAVAAAALAGYASLAYALGGAERIKADVDKLKRGVTAPARRVERVAAGGVEAAAATAARAAGSVEAAAAAARERAVDVAGSAAGVARPAPVQKRGWFGLW